MSDHAVEIVKGTPPVTVAALSFFGVSIPEVIQFLTLIYCVGIVVQQGYRLTKWISAWRKAHGGG
jgi:hypothetical protein